jgi:hypothetical protein
MSHWIPLESNPEVYNHITVLHFAQICQQVFNGVRPRRYSPLSIVFMSLESGQIKRVLSPPLNFTTSMALILRFVQKNDRAHLEPTFDKRRSHYR